MPRRPIYVHRALTLLGALVLSGCLAADGPSLSAADAYEQARNGSITLIDIRTPSEWRQTGVAEGARRIDMRDPRDPDGFANRVLAAVNGDKNAPIALICRTGNRTTHMQNALIDRGFTRVFNVKEGMAGSGAGPGWVKRGLPVEACRQC